MFTRLRKCITDVVLIGTLYAPHFHNDLIFPRPILRIDRWELVVHDPGFYNDLYDIGSTRRTDTWPRYRTDNGT